MASPSIWLEFFGVVFRDRKINVRGSDALNAPTDQLHLTPVDSIAQLRPQFHHLDAVVEQEKASSRTQRDMGSTARPAEPRAVQMTAKSTDVDEVDNNKEIAKTLKAAQEEAWTRLQYADENVSQIRSSPGSFVLSMVAKPPPEPGRLGGLLQAVRAGF